MTDFVHKRGDTFELAVKVSAIDENDQVYDLTGYTLVSKVRDPKGGLIASLDCSWIDATQGLASARATAGTAGWPLTYASMDIRLIAPDGFAITSDSISFEIRESISRD